MLFMLCKMDGLQTGDMYYISGPEKVVENKNIKNLWHFLVTLLEIQAKRTDLAVAEKKKEQDFPVNFYMQ